MLSEAQAEIKQRIEERLEFGTDPEGLADVLGNYIDFPINVFVSETYCKGETNPAVNSWVVSKIEDWMKTWGKHPT
jgi:hypothetical protein